MSKEKTRNAQLFAWAVVIAVVSFIAGARSDQIFAAIAPKLGVRYSAERLDTERIQETYRQLKAQYDGNLDTDKLINGASRGLVAATGDPYTTFMDAEEAKEFEKSLNGNIGGGIGAEIGLRNNRPTVVRVLRNSPAEEAQVKAGDIIIAVNGNSVADATTEQVVEKIRGEINTTVKLQVLRNYQRLEMSMTRKQITAPAVEHDIVDGVGILKVYRFGEETGTLARAAAEAFKQNNVQKVIVDLRSNPGGTVTAAQALAGLWLDNQDIMTERRGDKVIKTVKSTGKPLLQDIKTVVLIDRSSASASEIVAGALQEYGKAKLLGEKSYGKGSVQQLIKLRDGAQLKVTEARWYTPKGRTIDKTGIEPDEKVGLSANDMNFGKDPQMDAAKKLSW